MAPLGTVPPRAPHEGVVRPSLEALKGHGWLFARNDEVVKKLFA